VSLEEEKEKATEMTDIRKSADAWASALLSGRTCFVLPAKHDVREFAGGTDALGDYVDWRAVSCSLADELNVSEARIASLRAELEAKDRSLAEARSASDHELASLSAELEAKDRSLAEARSASDEAKQFFEDFIALYAEAEKEFSVNVNERGEVALRIHDLIFERVLKRGDMSFWFTRDLSRRVSLPADKMATFTPPMEACVCAPPDGQFVSLFGGDWVPLFSVVFKQSHFREYTGKWR
jgi:hypothetical protein